MDCISVIIPTKDAGENFEQVLKLIRSQDVPKVEIIVVDSGSTDNTLKVAEEIADIVIQIHPSEFHHGKTRNLGADAASGEIIVFTVQDALPASTSWLSNLISPIVTGTADATYGNQIAHTEAKPPDKFFYEYFYPNSKVVLSKQDTYDKKRFYLDNIFLSDVSSAISRSIWEEFKFRESIEMSEDKDLAFRIANAGYSLQYCPKAKVHHSHDYSLQSLFFRRYKDGMAFENIATDGSDDFLNEGVKYVFSEFHYLYKKDQLQWIPYTILYNFTYFISFTLGKNHKLIPKPIHKFLSN
ncbi:glycosyltransferase family 2 protein [Haladaptatus salinisoli]|uniref:glycosyltransferase family 2 protein n=1 Tax=Haladaptatus salinisoli TaxID=2884876 RepID=UPI001D0AA7C1|nr:glycosyltransferase [Haladaptatus salinisoli]